MPYIPNANQNQGQFVPTSRVWDNAQINSLETGTPNFKQLIVSLHQDIGLISIQLNKKDSGRFDVNARLTGSEWFNPDPSNIQQVRTEYRKVINFGALGAATKSVAHGINMGNGATTTFQLVDMWATATKKSLPFSALPIPYASSTAVINNIELSMDATNVTISNGIDRSAYTSCTVVIEYLLF